MKQVIYTKYANERDRRFSMYTQVLQDENRARSVQKMPACPEAEAHTRHIAEMEQKLRAFYAASGTGVNRCRILTGPAGKPFLELEYLTGETYENRVDAALRESGTQAALAMIRAYIDRIVPEEGQVPFENSSAFREVFGVEQVPESWRYSLPVTNIDAIMANMICTDDGGMQMFDFEWTFSFPVPVQFLIWRILNYYIETNMARKALGFYRTCEQFGIHEQEVPLYREMEASFQRYVRGGQPTLQDYYTELTPGVYNAQHAVFGARSDQSLQVYFDTGNGYSEQNTVLYPTKEGKIDQYIPVPEELKSIRIDPGARSCICVVHALEAVDQSGGKQALTFRVNGKKQSERVLIFPENDPQILIDKLPQHCVSVRAELVFSPVWPEVMQETFEETDSSGRQGGIMHAFRQIGKRR